MSKAAEMITLKDGSQVLSDEFYSWSKARQRGQLVSISAEAREQISMSVRAALASPEVKAKLSAATKGIPKSAEQRAKIAASNLGQKRSAETCARISEAKSGKKLKPISAEHKARIGEAKRAYWAARRAAAAANTEAK